MIEFNNFSKEYSLLGDEINAVFKDVLSSGKYVLDQYVSEFEKKFSNYLNVKHCVAVASGTDALTISLMALGISRGDEVITTGMTAYPTIIGILNAGAKPVLVDINLSDILINAEKIEAMITNKTRAIIPVHLYGQSCNMDKILEISRKFNLNIIEDCAQSTGTTYRKKMTGTIGDCGAFSFYPTKNLGCYGDGGAIATNSNEIYTKAKLLRNYGQGSSYQYNVNGINSRLDELQAAFLIKKLEYLDIWNNRRNEIAEKYIKNITKLKLLSKDPKSTHSYHLFVGRSNKRDDLSKYLTKNGVQTLVHYPISADQQVAFKEYKSKNLFNAIQASKEIISLPINPWLKDDEVDFIIKTINNF